MTTEHAIRTKFAHYFLDLKESIALEGCRVSKSEEWERFIGKMIEEGDLPHEAASWKCPRSLKAVIA